MVKDRFKNNLRGSSKGFGKKKKGQQLGIMLQKVQGKEKGETTCNEKMDTDIIIRPTDKRNATPTTENRTSTSRLL